MVHAGYSAFNGCSLWVYKKNGQPCLSSYTAACQQKIQDKLQWCDLSECQNCQYRTALCDELLQRYNKQKQKGNLSMTYVYSCTICGEMEINQSIKDAPLTECPLCGNNDFSRKISGGIGVIYKCGGFYSKPVGNISEPKKEIQLAKLK